MSKTVLLFRHGKSDFEGATDHARTLNDKGVRNAKAMGEFIRQNSAVPDLVMCSSATRALSTFELATEAGDWQAESEIRDDLYNTSEQHMMDVMHQLPESVSSVMFVGHEPTWSGLVHLLTGKPMLEFKAAAIACVELDVENWREVKAACGQLSWYEKP